MPDLIIYFIGIAACVFAFLTVVSHDIFHGAVWLSMALLSVSAIYFFLDAPFLGVIQVLVYIGGIITLFVFAIKLTARIGDKAVRQVNEQAIPSAIISLILFFFLVKAISARPWAASSPQAVSISLKDLGHSLLSIYVLPFEFLSLVLLAVMIGAIVIGKVKK